MESGAAFRTPITRRLSIRYPIFQAGMGFVAHAELSEAKDRCEENRSERRGAVRGRAALT